MIATTFAPVEYRHMAYDDYLHTYWWIHGVRLPALERAEWRCEYCHLEGGLEVHHRYYTDERGSIRGREEPQDLIVLCRGCHERYHKLLAVERKFFREAA